MNEFEDVRVIRSPKEINFCPVCGAKTTQHDESVGAQKTNLKIRCPDHGEIVFSMR